MFFSMTPNRNSFDSFERITSGQEILGNNKNGKVLGVGSVKLNLDDGTVKILQEVRYVP